MLDTQRVTLFWIALSLVTAIGCELAPNTAEPKTYERGGIAFSLPGNWAVSEDETDSGEVEYRYIIIESTGDAILNIMRYEPALDLSLEEFAKFMAVSMVEETQNIFSVGSVKPMSATRGTSAPIQGRVGGALREGIETQFVVSAFGVPVPHRSRIFLIESDTASVFLVLQAATEDWKTVAPGFDLIAESLHVGF